MGQSEDEREQDNPLGIRYQSLRVNSAMVLWRSMLTYLDLPAGFPEK